LINIYSKKFIFKILLHMGRRYTLYGNTVYTPPTSLTNKHNDHKKRE